jgi:hypothetical protein
MLAREKTAKEAVRQAIKLQAVFLVVVQKSTARTIWEGPTLPGRYVGTTRSQATYGVTAPTVKRQKTTSAGNEEKGLRQTHGIRQEDDDLEAAERRRGGEADRKVGQPLGNEWVPAEKGTPLCTLRPPPRVITEMADHNLVTQARSVTAP